MSAWPQRDGRLGVTRAGGPWRQSQKEGQGLCSSEQDHLRSGQESAPAGGRLSAGAPVRGWAEGFRLYGGTGGC